MEMNKKINLSDPEELKRLDFSRSIRVKELEMAEDRSEEIRDQESKIKAANQLNCALPERDLDRSELGAEVGTEAPVMKNSIYDGSSRIIHHSQNVYSRQSNAYNFAGRPMESVLISSGNGKRRENGSKADESQQHENLSQNSLNSLSYEEMKLKRKMTAQSRRQTNAEDSTHFQTPLTGAAILKGFTNTGDMASSTRQASVLGQSLKRSILQNQYGLGSNMVSSSSTTQVPNPTGNPGHLVEAFKIHCVRIQTQPPNFIPLAHEQKEIIFQLAQKNQ